MYPMKTHLGTHQTQPGGNMFRHMAQSIGDMCLEVMDIRISADTIKMFNHDIIYAPVNKCIILG
jgi:hypothetical protein